MTIKDLTRWFSPEGLARLRALDPKTQRKLLLRLGGGVLFIGFVLWPAWVARPQLQGRIRLLQNQIQSAQIKITQAPRLFEEQKEHEAFVQGVHPRLFKEGEGERLVGLLAGMANQSRVTLLSTEPQGSEAGGEDFPAPFNTKYRKVSHFVTVEGGYHALAEFVSEIENHPKIFRVSELSILPREDKPRVHQGRLVVSAFTLREEAKK